MPKYGKHLKLNVLLLIGLTTTINKFSTAETENLHNQKYDFIDVAKETANGRNRGQTTRIFTTGDDLDETFWLKYLGEEFRHAVHLQVDDDNNIVPIDNKKEQSNQFTTNNIETKEEKRTRFVRQPSADNKHIPVESLYKRDDNQQQYPTEKPEMFNVDPTTYSLDTKHHQQQQQHPHLYTTQYKNNKKALKNKKKVLIHNKYKQKIIKVKPPSPLKAIHEPIVVNLLEAEEGEHQIHGEQVPLVVQMPPVIYHQKADLYPEQFENLALYNEKTNLYNQEISNGKTDLYPEQTSNLPLNNQGNIYNQQIQNFPSNQHYQQTHSYTTQSNSQTNVHNSVQQNEHQAPLDYSTHSGSPQPYPYQSFPLSPISLAQLPVASFIPPNSR